MQSMPMVSSETNRHENHVIETIHGESKDLPWVLVAALTLRFLGSLPLDLVAVFERQHRHQLTGVEKLISTHGPWMCSCICHSRRNHLPTASRCQHPPMHNSWQIKWRGTKCCQVGTTRNRNHRTGALWMVSLRQHTLGPSWCAAPGRSSQCWTRGFPGLTANPQHMLGPSWSVRLLAAPHSVGPAVFLGSPPTHPTCSYRNANSCLDQQKEVRECNSATTAASVQHNLTQKENTNTCGTL